MKLSYSAKELADILGKTERSVLRQATKEDWKATREKCKGGQKGYRKMYLFAFLPEEVRVVIAQAEAAYGRLPLAGVGSEEGKNHGRNLRAHEAIAAEHAKIAREKGLALFRKLPAARQHEAKARFELLKARDAFVLAAGLPLKRGSLIFCDSYRGGSIRLPEWVTKVIGPTISWSSLNRWQQGYDSLGLAGLANGYKSPNKGKTTLAQAHQDFVVGMLKQHPGVSVAKIMAGIEARFADRIIPNHSAVRRFTNRWKEEHAALFLNISNPDEYKSKMQFALGSASENVERLNQMWEFDSTPADVMLVDGRHAVIGVIDVFSRRVKLLVTPTSKATAIAALTRRAILEWGVPEIAKTDNGADYVSNHMTRVFDGLGIEQRLCPPFTPEAKPHIERFFRTFSHDIVELLPGYIGHSVADRKAIEARKSFSQRLMQKEEVVEVKMTAGEFQKICDRWTEAIYHQNQHRGLDGKKPAEVARAWTGKIRRISEVRALDLLLSPAPRDGGFRYITKQGLRVENIQYMDPKMAGYIGERVQVLLDATDLGTIHVFLEDGEFLCSAVDPVRTGIDRAEIAARTNARAKEILREGRKELNRLAKDQAVKDIHQEILGFRESQIANISELPKKSEEYTTPALEEAGKAAKALVNQGKVPEPAQMSDEEFAQSEKILAGLQKKSGIRMAQPGSEWEAYELLKAEKEAGLELSDREERWLVEYDMFSMTGKRTGLVKEGWQPYAERARIARES